MKLSDRPPSAVSYTEHYVIIAYSDDRHEVEVDRQTQVDTKS
jgi:hypothetical protein